MHTVLVNITHCIVLMEIKITSHPGIHIDTLTQYKDISLVSCRTTTNDEKYDKNNLEFWVSSIVRVDDKVFKM